MSNSLEVIGSLCRSQLFLLTVTIALYCVAGVVFRRTRTALLHPVLLTFVALIFMLRAAGIDYTTYREATRPLDFLLGMSVVALGYLLYEESERLRGSLVPMLVSVAVGAVVGVLSAVYIAKWLGADRLLMTSLAPKSVTVPIAVAVVEPLGGDVSVTAVVVFCVGLFGNMFGSWILNRMKVTDAAARGLAYGSAAHGIGTARAVEEGAVQGAVSGLAMALMGVATALFVPLAERYLF